MHPVHQTHVPKNSLHLKEKDTIDEPNGQIVALNDKYLRLMAEFENYKRRSGKEKERLIEAAEEQLTKELIEVRENFERAFKSNDRGDIFVDGMKLNQAKLNSILQNHGLEAFGEPGDAFDPEIHEAVLCSPNKSIPDLHITDILQRGYTIKGKIVKHAKVAVSTGQP